MVKANAPGGPRRCPSHALSMSSATRPQKRVTRELVAVVFGCGALMLTPPCKPDGKSQSPFAKRRGREQAKRARRGCPFKIRTIAPSIPQVVSASSCGAGHSANGGVEEPSDDGRRHRYAARRADGLATSAALDPFYPPSTNSLATHRRGDASTTTRPLR